MPQVEIGKSEGIDLSNDTKVIQKNLETIPGGRSLDVTGITETVLKAGRVVIKDANGNHKPLAISGSSYVALPSNHTYAGILVASILTAKPFASILVRGTVNDSAAQAVAELPAVPAGAKTALPLIRFV